MDRRTFLTTSSLGGIATLAGCSTADAAVPAANPDDSLLKNGGWTELSDETTTLFQKSFAGFEVSATARTVVWEDKALRTRTKEETLGAVTTPLSIFSATRVQTDPSLSSVPGDLGKDKVVETARTKSEEKFKKRLSEKLDNVSKERLDRTWTVDTGEEAKLTKFTAEATTEETEFTVRNGKTITLGSKTIKIHGVLAVWMHNGSVMIVGGVHPAENFAETITKDVTDAITVTVDIDLGFKPSQFASEIEKLTKSTE